jgi:hypothetical protein
MFGHTDDNQQQGTNDPVVSSDNSQDNGGATDTNSYDSSEIPASSEPQNTESAAPDSFYSPPVAQDQSEQQSHTHDDSTTQLPASNASDVELGDIKQQALTALTPLVGHLDQEPLEKFKTTMMMIQAADDKSLIPEAYKAAQAITDEKAKAQALLDIVNEINYFTQSN